MNVLSVDFNYFFYSCLNLYANKVDYKGNIKQQWDNILFASDLDNFINCDYDKLSTVINVIISKLSNNTKLSFGLTGDEILGNICDVSNQNGDNDITLFNIDFFDDSSNTNEEAQDVIDFDKVNSRNWIDKLNQKFQFKYSWIKAPTSISQGSIVEREMNVLSLDQFVQFIDELDIDLIFMCFSPHYVPSRYYKMFNMIKELLTNIDNRFINCYNDNNSDEVDAYADSIYQEVLNDEYNVGS